jgi:hypothetical protein
VSDILVFYKTYPKKYNKASNEKRESILETIQRCHTSFLTHPEFGEKWSHIQNQWMNSIHRLAKERRIPSYTRVEVEREGGRGSHHDFHFVYYDGDIPVGTILIEFKHGANNINKLPQILSLAAKFPLVQETFDVYWYYHGYDTYRATIHYITTGYYEGRTLDLSSGFNPLTGGLYDERNYSISLTNKNIIWPVGKTSTAKGKQFTYKYGTTSYYVGAALDFESNVIYLKVDVSTLLVKKCHIPKPANFASI